MTFRYGTSKLHVALLLTAAIGLGASIAHAEQAAQPPATPAASEAATQDQATEPAASAEPAAAQPEAAAVVAPAAAPAPQAAVSAKDMPIGTSVFGTDGAKIGEVNRVTSEPNGAVTEIHVTMGGAAGLNAKVFAVSADKIAATKDGVKLSLSSQEAKSLPVLDNGNG